MEFTYYGGNCLLVTTKNLKVIIDPPEKTLRQKADVVLSSTQSDIDFVHKEGFKIASPGEYEIKALSIHGVPAQRHIDKPDEPLKGVMYVLEHKGVHALICGNIAPELRDSQLEAIGQVDIVVVPVGGHGLTLDANSASNVVGRFEPGYIIPVHYDDGKTKYEMPQDKVDNFLKEVGSEGVKPVPKLRVTEKDLQEGISSVVVLTPQN